MTEKIRCCAVIPHYNHSVTLASVVTKILSHGLYCYIVDDGSSSFHQQQIKPLANLPNVTIIFKPNNGGKGSAMKEGLKKAAEEKFTHVLQIDADAQHDLTTIVNFLTEMQKNPASIICGNPVYASDAPTSRLLGRKITNFWLAIHTLSTTIKDGMCGFRLYPLKPVIFILERYHIPDKMEFDIEILVRLKWQQVPFVWLDVPVSYAPDGVSHFNLWHDNWLITKMHFRLFFTMLLRLTGLKL